MRKIEVFRKRRVRHLVQFLRGCQVTSERLLHDHARIRVQLRGTRPSITVSKSEGGIAR